MIVLECVNLLPVAFNLNGCLHSQNNSLLCWIYHNFGGKNSSLRPFRFTNPWIKSWELKRTLWPKHLLQLSPKISEVTVEFITHSSEVFNIFTFVWVCIKLLMVKLQKQISWGGYLYIKYLLVNEVKNVDGSFLLRVKVWGPEAGCLSADSV